jgi:hypothetical protein
MSSDSFRLESFRPWNPFQDKARPLRDSLDICRYPSPVSITETSPPSNFSNLATTNPNVHSHKPERHPLPPRPPVQVCLNDNLSQEVNTQSQDATEHQSLRVDRGFGAFDFEEILQPQALPSSGMIMLLSQVEGFPGLRQNLISFMRTECLRKEIQKRCNLYSEYNCASQDREAILSNRMTHQFYAFLHFRQRETDLVSWAIPKCPSCIRFLLYYRAIRPSYYNSDGESLLYLALTHRKKKIARILTCSLTIKDLASPLWLTCQEAGPSALDIASSNDFVIKQNAPWNHSEENYSYFMYETLKKHPQKKRIWLVYLKRFDWDHPRLIQKRFH